MEAALLNKKGLTLVEVMIALVIVLLVFLALMQTALVSIESNTVNLLREEAVSIAEMRMNQSRSVLFTNLVSDAGSLSGCDCPTGFSSTGDCVKRDIRSMSQFNFCTNLTCQELGGDGNCATDDSDNKQIIITVGWKWKGNPYRHSITTIRRRT